MKGLGFSREARRWWPVAAMVLLLAAGSAIAAREGDDEVRNLAVQQLQNGDAEARIVASNVLAEVGAPENLAVLHSHLFDDDERVRGVAEAAIWAIWSRSGDPAVDRLFRRGLEQMQDGRLQTAIQTFTRVIGMRPDFAEAWNKRATVLFLLGDDDDSLKDCDEVYKRNPQHFGVLAGYGQIYMRKGDLPRALEYFEKALAVNPNMAGVQASIDAVREILIRRGKRFI